MTLTEQLRHSLASLGCNPGAADSLTPDPHRGVNSPFPSCRDAKDANRVTEPREAGAVIPDNQGRTGAFLSIASVDSDYWDSDPDVRLRYLDVTLSDGRDYDSTLMWNRGGPWELQSLHRHDDDKRRKVECGDDEWWEAGAVIVDYADEHEPEMDE